MAQSKKPYVIVVAVDYSESGELAFDRALELADDRANAELHVLHVLSVGVPAVVPALGFAVAGSIPAIDEAAERLTAYVEKKVRTFRADRPERSDTSAFRVVPHLRVDTPAFEIAQLATDLEADLVVVGTHGRRAISRFVLGSVAEVTVRFSPCPVLVVRPKALPAPVPTIEPPWPRCVEARIASGRRELWCEQHGEEHGQRHTYHQSDRAAAETNMPLVMR